MQLVEKEKTVTSVEKERNTAEELDAEIIEIEDSRFRVRLQKTVFTAEASENREGKTLEFGEETEVEEFSTDFVDTHYSRFIPGPWELLEDVEVAEPFEPIPPKPRLPEEVWKTREKNGISSSPLPHPQTPETVEPERIQRGERDYRDGTREEYTDWLPRGTETRSNVESSGNVSPGYEPAPPQPVTEVPWGRGREDDTVMEDRGGDVKVYTVEAERSAEEVVQEMLEYTDLEGEVERKKFYGLTEDFEGDAPEAYWVDIEGMDMDRTEYFINGELAEDSIDNYRLGPGDRITFVESEVFEDAEYCGGELYLDEAVAEADKVENYQVPTSVTERIPSEPLYLPAA